VLATVEAAGRAPGEAAFTEIGEALYRELMPPAVADALFRWNAPPVSLLLDPALIPLPWELLCREGDFLCLQRPLARQTIVSPELSRPAGPARDTRFLIVANPDGSLPATQDEGEALLHTLVEDEGITEVSFLASRRARKQDVLRQLQSASVVYYLGHARHDAAHPRNSAWVLADGLLTAAELGQLATPPELVIANACESARESLEHQTPGAVLPPEGAGLGLSLLLAGVRHYVGTLWRVPAVSAAGCGAVLLRDLLDGAPIGEALLSARRDAREHQGDSAMTWAAYALYGNPLWRLRP
jgi:CHAT domain-containing protein